MSRISRYQESIGKFIRNKSSLNDLSDEQTKKNILDIVKDSDYLCSILLLTILNNQSKKNNINVHGYYIASGINHIMTIIVLLENKEFYSKIYTGPMIDRIINELILQINICLALNIETIEPHYTADKIIKIYHKCIKLINKKLINILTLDELLLKDNILRTDIIKYHFENLDEIKKKLVLLRKIDEPCFHQFIANKYGTLCQLALSLGWILGGGDEKLVYLLDKIGIYFSKMIKITIDFSNLEENILELDNQKSSNNFVVNYGIQHSFEVFMQNKEKFISGCIKLNIYTNTIKEIIDLLEHKIDDIIDDTSMDMRSEYTI
jgi:hypothetical protein